MRDTPLFNNKYFPFLLLLILSIPLFFMNIHERHSWGGDDYALYIKEAQNIANGIPYHKTNFVFYDRNISYSPPQYPPGFPLLLAPVVKVWGLSIKPMCYLITSMVAMLMLVVFAWFRKQRGVGAFSAFCLALLIGYSWFIVEMKHSVWSDIPCLLFTMLYLLYRQADTYKLWRIALLVLFATMAIMIRTQAILLVGAEVLLLTITAGKELYQSKRISKTTLAPAVYIICGILLFNFIVGKLIFPTPSTASGFYVNYLKDILHSNSITSLLRNNVNFFMEALNGFFYYATDSGFRTALVTIMQSAGLVLTIIGFGISVSRKLKVEDVFFVLLIGLMLYYPIHDKRYFMPAIAIVYYYCYVALQSILPPIIKIPARKMGIAITIACLFTGFKYLRSTLDQPTGYVPAANDFKAFNYINTHVSDSDIILFSRPRFLTLYTNKRSMVQAWLLPMDQNRQIFDSMKVKYALTVKGLADDFNNHYLSEVQRPIDSVVIADGYTLYRLR